MRHAGATLFLSVVCASSACQQVSGPNGQPYATQNATLTTSQPSTPENLTDATMHPGDRLRFSIFELVTPNLTWNGEAVVDENGWVALPKLGQIQVAGLASKEIETKISQSVWTCHIGFPPPSGTPGPEVTVERILATPLKPNPR